MVTRYDEEATLLIPNHGIPTGVRDDREPRKKQLVVNLILASTLFERIAFYSIAANLVISLGPTGPLHWKPSHSFIATLIFTGTSYISTLIFAILSDAKCGRAKTIILGFVLYLTGYLWAIVVSSPPGYKHLCRKPHGTNTTNTDTILDELCAPWILPTLIVIAIGTGAVQSNMPVFGAEQIQESKPISRYFDRHVVVMNISAIFAKLTIPFIQTAPHLYYIGYVVAASMLSVAILLFLIGRRYYIHATLHETVVSSCIPVVINAFQSWYKYERNISAIDNEQVNSASSNLLNASQSLAEEEESIRLQERPSTFLDFAKVPHGKFHDRIVDDVKSLRSALIVFGLFIPYWLIYNQLDSTFPAQRQTMFTPRWITPRYRNAFITSISFGDPITIIIGILILNKFIYKYLDARNQPLTMTKKFVIGMCFASLTMCISGIVESVRQHQCYGTHTSDLSIFAQIPQNVFMGVSGLFFMVASFEFAYFAAPRSAQTLFMSLRFCSIGLSSFLGAAYALLRLDEDLNLPCLSNGSKYWEFYTFFFALAGLQLLFILIFIVCQKKFRIIKLNPQQVAENRFFHHTFTSSSGRH